MPATPELLAQVEALPPATDTPDIDEARAVRPEESYGLRRLLRGFGAAAAGEPGARRRRRGHEPAPAGADPARHRPGRHADGARRGLGGLRARPARRAGAVGRADRRDPDDGPHRRTGALLTAPEDLRAAPAARPRLLRARADRPHHDPDDDGRRRAVHVPADRSGHGLRLRRHLLRHHGRAARHRRPARTGRLRDAAGAGHRHVLLPPQERARRTNWPASGSASSTPTSRSPSPGCGSCRRSAASGTAPSGSPSAATTTARPGCAASG